MSSRVKLETPVTTVPGTDTVAASSTCLCRTLGKNLLGVEQTTGHLCYREFFIADESFVEGCIAKLCQCKPEFVFVKLRELSRFEFLSGSSLDKEFVFPDRILNLDRAFQLFFFDRDVKQARDKIGQVWSGIGKDL